MLRLIKVSTIAILIVLFPFAMLFPAVTIIRKVPTKEQNVVNAQWKKAPPPPEVGKKYKTTISGKAELGGTGGTNVNGDSLFNLYTDSNVSLSRPFASGGLNINVAAFRKSYLQGSDDDYSVGLDLSTNLWRFGIDARYKFFNKLEKDENQLDVKKNGNDLNLGVNASTSIIESMPLSISYNHEEKNQEENRATTEDIVENNVNFSTNGSFGDFSVGVSGSFNNKEDIAKSMLTRQYGANINVGYAINDILNVSSYINPGSSITQYTDTGTDVKSTILDYGVGLFMPFSDSLELTTDLGRVDNWTNSSQGSNPIWKASAGVVYKPIDKISVNGSYNMNKVVSGNLQNQFNIDGIYNGEEDSVVQSIGTGGGVSYTSDNSGAQVSTNTTWKGDISLLPVNNITIDLSYNGGFNKKYDPSLLKLTSIWNHTFVLDFKHDITETLNYNLSAKLSGYLPEDLAKQIKQDYGAGVTFAPSIGWRTLILTTSENFSITKTGSNKDLSSQASFGSSINATKYISTHYNFGWSWINLNNSAPANNFSHNVGFLINGKKKPMNFGTDYTLNHGDAGIKHTIESNFYYPFSNNLGLRAWINFSSYKENGEQKNPFVLGASSIYTW